LLLHAALGQLNGDGPPESERDNAPTRFEVR
jgi:hypothetical protein